MDIELPDAGSSTKQLVKLDTVIVKRKTVTMQARMHLIIIIVAVLGTYVFTKQSTEELMSSTAQTIPASPISIPAAAVQPAGK